MGNDIKNKFDDIDGKIDILIALCQTLQQENRELKLTVMDLENKLEKTSETEKLFVDQETLIQSKIDGLINKLNHFSNTIPGNGT